MLCPSVTKLHELYRYSVYPLMELVKRHYIAYQIHLGAILSSDTVSRTLFQVI